MEKLINKLKESEKITAIYSTNDGKIIMTENKRGTVVIINAKYEGYQWSIPIRPNHKTGSGIAGAVGYDYILFDEMIKIAEDSERFIPGFFSEQDRESVKFESLSEHLKTGLIWHKKIK